MNLQPPGDCRALNSFEDLAAYLVLHEAGHAHHGHTNDLKHEEDQADAYARDNLDFVVLQLKEQQLKGAL